MIFLDASGNLLRRTMMLTAVFLIAATEGAG